MYVEPLPCLLHGAGHSVNQRESVDFSSHLSMGASFVYICWGVCLGFVSLLTNDDEKVQSGVC